MCVTNTERTASEAPLNPSLDLEDEKIRRKNFSPGISNSAAVINLGRKDKETSTDAGITVSAKPEEARISTQSHGGNKVSS